jgi:hypothetical protein
MVIMADIYTIGIEIIKILKPSNICAFLLGICLMDVCAIFSRIIFFFTLNSSIMFIVIHTCIIYAQLIT